MALARYVSLFFYMVINYIFVQCHRIGPSLHYVDPLDFLELCVQRLREIIQEKRAAYICSIEGLFSAFYLGVSLPSAINTHQKCI